MSLKKSTKVSRRKVVQSVKACVYGVAIGMNPNLISNNYGPSVKRFGPHRGKIAAEVKRRRSISTRFKSVRGADSVHDRHLR